MNREEAMTAFIRAGEQLKHEDDCPHAEGKWDGGCTCKRAMGYEKFRDKVIQEKPEEYWYEKGKIDAEQRIIKLLEEHTYYGQDGWLEFSDKALTRADLEALIKGEQK